MITACFEPMGAWKTVQLLTLLPHLGRSAMKFSPLPNHRKVTEKDLEALVGRISQDYIDFLVKWNGGFPGKPAFEVWHEDLEVIDVGSLWSIDDRCLEQIDDHFYIGDDTGGNFLMMGLSEDIRGHVFWVDYAWTEDIDNPSNAIFVAPSFSDFFTGLTDHRP